MQKNKALRLLIDHKSYDLDLSIRRLDSQDPSFLEKQLYPHVFFKPKEAHFELKACGAALVFEKRPHVKAPHYIPFFTMGDGECLVCFLPIKWQINMKGRIYQFEILNFEPKNLNPILINLKTTEKVDAIQKMERIIEDLRSGRAKKCVFSQIQNKKEILPITLEDFANTQKEGIFFYFKLTDDLIFCGISPEWIYKRINQKLEIEAIAGTSIQEEPHKLEDEKIIDEFNYVKEGIQESVALLIEKGSFEIKDSCITANHLIHRYNKFCAKLKGFIHDESLIATVHPTAAIIGLPKKQALDLLKLHESSDRFFFGSPVGCFNKRLCFMALGIRSCLIQKNEAFFFSGAGIVKDSDPIVEWEELMNKTKLMRSIIK